jgi:penicillin-binding protein 1A
LVFRIYSTFGSEALGQGAAAALPIWALFMQKLYADKSLKINPDAKFESPENFNDCDVLVDPTSIDRGRYGNGFEGDDETEQVPEIPDDEY